MVSLIILTAITDVPTIRIYVTLFWKTDQVVTFGISTDFKY